MIKILSHFAHATYQTNLSKIPDTEFYHMVNSEGGDLENAWIGDHGEKPNNVFGIQEAEAVERLKDFDVFLMHRHPLLQKYENWKIPKIFVEHTAPWPHQNQAAFWAPIRAKTTDLTVFITKSSMKAWGMVPGEQNVVIRHAIDVSEYPDYSDTPEDFVATVVNAFIERDWACGYSLWSKVVWPFPDVRVYGFGNDNLGTKYCKGFLSQNEVKEILTKTGVYFNPATASPIPMSLMEAMAVGVPIVTTAYYEAGLLMENGKHGIVTNDPTELQKGIKFMLENRDEAKRMGQNAKELVTATFPLAAFTQNWEEVLDRVGNLRK